MKCPHCGLLNPDGSQWCDCGYNFESRSIKISESDRARIAEVANSRLTTSIVLAIAALITFGILLYAAQKSGWVMVAFVVWLLLPYSVLALIAFRSAATVRVSFIVLVCSTIISVLGVSALVNAVFFNLHSTSGLIFFSLPVLQWLGCAVTWIIASAAGTPKKL